jgi:hypothetical protein
MFLLSFTVSSINAADPRLIFNLDWEGLVVQIYAPWQAYPNNTMTIRIIVDPKEDLMNVTVNLEIYGSMNEGKATWPRHLVALENRDMDLGEVEDQYFNVSIPESVDPGLLHGHIYCSWKVWRNSSWQEQSIAFFDAHRVTYLRNKPYEDLKVTYNQLLANYSSLLSSYDQLLKDYNYLQTSYNDLENSYNSLQANYNALLTDHNNLQTDYDSLNSTYYNLLSDYSSLQTSFNELKSKYEFGGETASTLNLMYVFIETTVIFIATTIYFARVHIHSALRKSKQQT